MDSPVGVRLVAYVCMSEYVQVASMGTLLAVLSKLEKLEILGMSVCVAIVGYVFANIEVSGWVLYIRMVSE